MGEVHAVLAEAINVGVPKGAAIALGTVGREQGDEWTQESKEPTGSSPTQGRKSNKGKSNSSVKSIALIERLEATGYCCELTGWKLEPDTAALDHKSPISKGGQHTMDNVAIIHESVNRANGTMTWGEFVDMCRAVTEHVK